MKKLGTLRLKNVSVLSEKEMKQVFGGSGFTGSSGAEERVWDCLCFGIPDGAVDGSGAPLSPDKKVTVKSNDYKEVLKIAQAACPEYSVVTCD